jgi:hypothetical protein
MFGDSISDDELMARPESKTQTADPIGWYVRVTTVEIHDGVYNSLLYIAGFAIPAEAEKAVRQVRRMPTDTYEVLPGQITSDRGPQPVRGEVRLVDGAA